MFLWVHEMRLLEFNMKDTAPKSSGIIAVAALFSIVSMGVSFVVFQFSFGQSLIVGAAVATLVGVVLSLGWREPQAGPSEKNGR
jgi:protein-S-isoprenylcysteine O-methyltransferase Ste14